MKYSIIKPIYKNGDKLKISNYRPVSLITGFSKIMEIVTCRRLQQRLRMCNMLTSEQYGFQDNNATYKLINSVYEAKNNKQYTAYIFCDITMALDCESWGSSV